MIRVVLCRPMGPRNVGSVLRASLNFGPAEVVLVAPRRRSILIHPDFEQMAHGVEEMAARVRVVDTLNEALADCTTSVGFTARKRGHAELVDWRELAPDVCARAHADGARMALVFGSEEGGLNKAECALLETLTRMPTSEEHTSLNLASAVTVVLAAIFFAEAPSAAADARTPLDGAARDLLIHRAISVLGPKTLSAPARRDVEAMLERVLRRAPMETRDARAWHLLLRALGGEMTPEEIEAAREESS